MRGGREGEGEREEWKDRERKSEGRKEGRIKKERKSESSRRDRGRDVKTRFANYYIIDPLIQAKIKYNISFFR